MIHTCTKYQNVEFVYLYGYILDQYDVHSHYIIQTKIVYKSEISTFTNEFMILQKMNFNG